MYDLIAMIDANKQMHDQFRDIPERERLEPVIAETISAPARVRLRISLALHALANAIEPPPVPQCGPNHAR